MPAAISPYNRLVLSRRSRRIRVLIVDPFTFCKRLDFFKGMQQVALIPEALSPSIKSKVVSLLSALMSADT
jgi:hypothetical protein